MPRLPFAARLAVDSFYVSLGFGVLGFQKVQVKRREVERSVADRRSRLGVEGPIGSVNAGVDMAVDHLVSVLPSPVDEAVDATRSQARRALGATVGSPATSTSGA